jgi:hypothetical protein
MSDRLHKFCRERCHIPPHYFSLWDFANAVCIANGCETFLVYPARAAWHTCSSENSVRRAARWLAKNGWFETVQKPERGFRTAGEYRVLNHDQWIKKYGQRRRGSECIAQDYGAPGAAPEDVKKK